jgi:hypothetical protein
MVGSRALRARVAIRAAPRENSVAQDDEGAGVVLDCLLDLGVNVIGFAHLSD